VIVIGHPDKNSAFHATWIDLGQPKAFFGPLVGTRVALNIYI
jgi:hypothetical protein